MIVSCEKCGTRFQLDESLLKGTGSRVRCSVCAHMFTAYPPEGGFDAEGETMALEVDAFGETATLGVQRPAGEAVGGPEEAGEDRGVDAVDAEAEAVSDQVDSISDKELKELLKWEGEGDRQPEPFTEEPFPFPEDDAPSFMEEAMEAHAAAETMPAGKRRFGVSMRLTLLIFLLLILAGGIGVFLWAPHLIPDSLSFLKPPEKRVFSDLGVRRLSFRSVKGTFVDSQKAGRLFVVQGIIRNDYPTSRSFLLIKGALLDDQGKEVMSRMTFAGNPLTEEEIKDLPMDAMLKAMKNRYGKGKGNVNLAAGGNIPFTIVFDHLPDNLGEFTVEAVSSSPGS